MQFTPEERKNRKIPVDLTGKKFGKLTVISICDERYVSPHGKKHNKWNCICECGNKITPDTGNLNKGVVNSCGCYITPEGLARRHKGRKEDASAGDIYSSYKVNARKRNYSFNISKADAIKFFKQDCYYCGAKPSCIARKCALPFIYNGIDRKDNKIGYEIDNCVPCCKTCNRMKMILSHDIFLNKISQIYKNLIQK